MTLLGRLVEFAEMCGSDEWALVVFCIAAFVVAYMMGGNG